MTTQATFDTSKRAESIRTDSRVSVDSLSGFYRPEHGATLIDSAGKPAGVFDYAWSSDLILWCNDGEQIRSSSWIGLMAQLVRRF